MEQLRKDSKSKEKNKSASKVTISSPVSDVEQLQQHCCVLEYTNEVGMFHTMYMKNVSGGATCTLSYLHVFGHVYIHVHVHTCV